MSCVKARAGYTAAAGIPPAGKRIHGFAGNIGTVLPGTRKPAKIYHLPLAHSAGEVGTLPLKELG